MSNDTRHPRIDVHAHAFTPEFTRVLRKSVSRPLAIRSIWEWDENRFLGEMDRWDVTLQVLSLPQMYEYFDWGNRQPSDTKFMSKPLI